MQRALHIWLVAPVVPGNGVVGKPPAAPAAGGEPGWAAVGAASGPAAGPGLATRGGGVLGGGEAGVLALSDAVTAQALDLEGHIRGEAELGGGLADRAGSGLARDLVDVLAGPAYQQRPGVIVIGPGAANEGIERIEAMGETGADEKVEGPVHRHRCRHPVATRQLAEDLVGADGLMAAPDDLEDLAAGRSQGQAALLAHPLGRAQCFALAGGVVVA